MAIDAQRALLRANQRIVRFQDRVIAVTRDAFAELFVVEGLLMRARLE